MQIETTGILINIKPFSERDAIAHIFTKDNGVLVGMLRGGVSAKKNKPLVGQYGNVSWVARLDSQLGVFQWVADKNLSAPLILNPELLKIMNSVFSLIFTLLPERESYEKLYNETLNLMKDLPNEQNPRTRYLQWEIVLLRELGYALDLSKCSGCGRVDNLCYLSPRTGRAVCAECGEPYRGRLYDLPLNLDTTLRFISGICDIQGTDIPPARKML